MANRYVYNGGSNTSPYDTWAKAATTLTTGITGTAAGDNIFVASDHVESTAAAVTLSATGTNAAPCRIISVNRAGSVPPTGADVLAGATITTTGASAISIAGSGTNYYSGITFNCGTGATAASITLSNASNANQVFENCAFNLPTTATASRVVWGNNAQSKLKLLNCTHSFGNVSQGIQINCPTEWRNKPGSVAVTGATIPTSLFAAGGNGVKVELSGLDLSASGSGKTIVGSGAAAAFDIINCKLGTSVTIAGPPGNAYHQPVRLMGSSTTTNVRRDELYRYEGTLTTETTIKRTAGASDGTTAYSWKVVTQGTSGPERETPFETFEGALWNATTGSPKTLTVHTVTDNVTLTDAEIWVEVEYLGSSATPVTSMISDGAATILTTGAAQTSASAEAWTTTGLTTPVKQKLEVTFTPQMVGPIRWRVKVAKISTTVYIDPNPDLT